MTPLRCLCPILPSREAELQRFVQDQRSLEQVTRALWAADPPLDIADVIPQDEYTHDVVVPLPDGLVLVYDTT